VRASQASGAELSVPPGDFPRDFLFHETHPAEIVMIGQLQDVGFVFLEILIGRGDEWKSASLGHY